MIVRLTTRIAVALAALAGLAVGAGTPAAADTFGQHVRHCAQTVGFDGEHNPGMHRGLAGWSPEHFC